MVLLGSLAGAVTTGTPAFACDLATVSGAEQCVSDDVGNVLVLDPTSETGAGIVPDPSYPSDAAYVSPVGPRAAKEELNASIAAGTSQNLALLATSTSSSESLQTPAATGCGGEVRCPPTSYDVPFHPNNAQQKKYTCGPSSARNLIAGWTGSTPTEVGLEYEMHTSPDYGTYIPNIARVLNNHSGGADTFYIVEPTDPVDLMSRITSDTYNFGHGVVLNVNTVPLRFWNNHAARHFNLAYGYSHYSGGSIHIAEEWDPSRFGISGYGIPYGYRNEPLSNVYNAVHSSPTQSIVW